MEILLFLASSGIQLLYFWLFLIYSMYVVCSGIQLSCTLFYAPLFASE